MQTFSARHGTPTTARRGPSAESQAADACRDISSGHKFDIFFLTAAECNEQWLFRIKLAISFWFVTAPFSGCPQRQVRLSHWPTVFWVFSES